MFFTFTVSFSPTAQSLTVTVTSNSTTYHIATSVTLTCRVSLEAVQPVSYQWSSSCSGECSVAGQTDDTVTISLLRSIDSGTHTCTVTDNVGNTGNGSINFNVTGKFVDGEERTVMACVFCAYLHSLIFCIKNYILITYTQVLHSTIMEPLATADQ